VRKESEHQLTPHARYLWTLELVYKEGGHLQYSWKTIFSPKPPTLAWVESLSNEPDQAVFLEAFLSRFGRMQDTLADKLLPRWLECLSESRGSQIENLNKAERLGVITSTENWLIARKLRNQLVHEYMTESEPFYESLMLARDMSLMLVDTYNRIRGYKPELIIPDCSLLPPKLL